ncbi:hypothetical protein RRG08_063840 [Elysia crispata]|uniref:Uncharacterized protein n=1 Tax=Elysia crispata TaxID=231223 RepID=A0AAE0Y568_9GAST|nr:hypothetical protein RRG08_063840 [Elysia crispata]
MEMLYLGGDNVPYSYRTNSSGHGYHQFQSSPYCKYDLTSSCAYGGHSVPTPGTSPGSLHGHAAGYVPASDNGQVAGAAYRHHRQVLPTAFGGYHPFQQMTSSCMGFFQRRPGRIKGGENYLSVMAQPREGGGKRDKKRKIGREEEIRGERARKHMCRQWQDVHGCGSPYVCLEDQRSEVLITCWGADAKQILAPGGSYHCNVHQCQADLNDNRTKPFFPALMALLNLLRSPS